MSRIESKVADDLATTVESDIPTDEDPRIGWAWADSDYRASNQRAFHGPTGALTLTDPGVSSLEDAMSKLLSLPAVKTNWKEDDLWTVVLSLIGTAASDPSLDMTDAVGRVVTPRATRIAAALANVNWDSAAATIGNLSLARMKSEEDAREFATHMELDAETSHALVDHNRQLLLEFGEYVVASGQSDRQESLAHSDFERSLEELVGLVLLLSERLDDFGVYSLRGGTNRPGIRGLALDRGALGERLGESGAGELGARLLVVTGWSAGNSFRWFSADPLPLDRLLEEPLRTIVNGLLLSEDPIAQRLRLASRWYARAFWSEAHDDAALAVSVGLDSMLTGKEAVPGAVSKGRFALLERNVHLRSARLKRYDEIYSVRSAIAHGGGGTGLLAKIGGARAILAEAHWVALRLLELRSEFAPAAEPDLRDVWEGIQWGSLPWATGA